LVTRGYAAIGRRPSGWTHGGLTPEETIVPLMHLNNHLPTRDQKEQLKARLQNGETLTVLDPFSVSVDLQHNELRLSIPCLDERKAGIERRIADQYPLLFSSGVWGVGKLQ